MTTREKKSITLTREAEGVYVATNAAGASVRFGHNAEGGMSSVELLLAAIAGCSSTDVDVMTSRRAEPTTFTVTVSADKLSGGAEGNILSDIVAEFDVQFPDGDDGDKARSRVAPAIQAAHDRTCTVSRTVQAGVPITMRQV